MEEPTEFLRASESAEFRSSPTDAAGADLLWAREGEAPRPGSPGSLLPVGEDPLAIAYRARLGDGTVFLAEIQRDAVDPAAFPASWGPVTNAVLQGIWRRRTAAAATEVESGEGGGPPVSLGLGERPGLVVCREKSALFSPPSPETARIGALDDCRDEAILQRAQLPSWQGSAARFLIDSVAAQSTSEPRFYTAAREVPRGATSVRTWDQYVRDLATLVDSRRAGDPRIEALRGRFACIGCDQVPKCYPVAVPGAPPAQFLALKRLAPVAFHPYRAVAEREEVARLDEHADILGGATWQAFRSRHATHWTQPAVRMRREALEREVFARVEAVDPLSAVTQKLALFEAVVETVAKYHRRHGQPHLGLSPSTIVSHTLFPKKRGATYEVSLRGTLRTASLADIAGSPPGDDVWLPPPGAEAPWAHSDIARAAEPWRTAPPDTANVHEGGFRYGRPTQVRVTAGRVWEEEGVVECELNVSGNGIPGVKLEPADLVRVTLARPGWSGVTLWCRPDMERVAATDSEALRSFRRRMDSAQVLDLRAAGRGEALFGTVVVYRSYGAWYDVHALGVLLFQMLLENSARSLTQLVGDVLPSIAPFGRAVHDRPNSKAWDELVSVLATVSRSAPLDVSLSDANACFFPGEIPDAKRRVPPQTWAELLAIVVACVTRHEGVSFGVNTRLVRDRDEFCRPVEALLSRLRAVRAALPKAETSASTAATFIPFDEPAVPVFETLPPAADLANENAQLRRSLEAEAARVARLESELAGLVKLRSQEERRAKPGAPDLAAQAVWRRLVEAILGAPAGQVADPAPGQPAVELVTTLASEGLETLTAVLVALAELGGHEFASEQRNLQRQVRQALTQALADGTGDPRRVQEALDTLRQVRPRLGRAIAMLVEAHGRSARDGTRKLLLTIDVALRKELDLKGSNVRQLEAIMSRLNSSVSELVGMLYDPVFEEQVRRQLRPGGGDERSSGTGRRTT